MTKPSASIVPSAFVDIDVQMRLQGANDLLHLNLQMQIKQGQFASVYGASGAGKTTLLRLLAGLSHPHSGQIKVAGETWLDTQRKIQLRPQERAVGMVFQDLALFPHLTVEENIAYGVPKNDSAMVQRLLEVTQLGVLRKQLPKQLSGGQKQRVALARALVRRPQILLLDEPLSALDNAMRANLQDELQALHQEFGLTTLMVSHDLGEIFKLSEHVFVLEQGRIVKQGAPSEVFLKTEEPGKLQLHAQILAIRQEQVIAVLSLLVGQEIIEVAASPAEVSGLRVGAMISIAPKAFSPQILKTSQD